MKKELSLSLPSILWLIFFFLIPTLLIFTIAFKPTDIYGGIGEGWSSNAFYSLFDANYLILLYRTLWLSFLTTFACVVLSLPIGYYLALTTPRIRQVLLLLIIIPFWSSFLVRIFAWKSFLHPEGLFKKVLVSLNLVSPETSLLYNAGAVLLVMIYTYLPFAILPIYAAASKFNFQLIEAALDLGASQYNAFCKIFIPSIKKGIMTAIIMVFVPALGAYVIPDLVGGTQSEMIGNKIVQRTLLDRNLPLASALSTFLALLVFIPVLTMTLIQYRSKKIRFEGRSKE